MKLLVLLLLLAAPVSAKTVDWDRFVHEADHHLNRPTCDIVPGATCPRKKGTTSEYVQYQ